MPSREKSREYSNRSSAKRRKKYADFIAEYKLESGCELCGYNKHACALQFDHRDPSEKLFNVARGRDYPWKVFLAEIAKCRILCANCHAVETYRKKHYHRNPA